MTASQSEVKPTSELSGSAVETKSKEFVSNGESIIGKIEMSDNPLVQRCLDIADKIADTNFAEVSKHAGEVAKNKLLIAGAAAFSLAAVNTGTALASEKGGGIPGQELVQQTFEFVKENPLPSAVLAGCAIAAPVLVHWTRYWGRKWLEQRADEAAQRDQAERDAASMERLGLKKK